jgi:hypothetical protein
MFYVCDQIFDKIGYKVFRWKLNGPKSASACRGVRCYFHSAEPNRRRRSLHAARPDAHVARVHAHVTLPWRWTRGGGPWLQATTPSQGAFSTENFWLLATVALSFVFDKSCLIMDYLGLKDSSRQLQANCAISYSFYLHLMLHACAARFDVTENLENFWFLGRI